MESLHRLTSDLRMLQEDIARPGAVHHRAAGDFQKQRDGTWARVASKLHKVAAAVKAGVGHAIKKAGSVPVVGTGARIAGHMAVDLAQTGWETLKTGKVKAARHLAHEVKSFYKGAYDLVMKPEARGEMSKTLGKAFRSEAKETKALGETMWKALKGGKVTDAERDAATDQVADLVKTGLLLSFGKHIVAHGALATAAAVAVPDDPIIGSMLDGPLRRATKKVLGREHGILPSGFYQEPEKHEGVMGALRQVFQPGKAKAEAEKAEQVAELMEKIFSEVLKELAAEGIDVKALEAQLGQGMDRKQAEKLMAAMQSLAKH